MTDRQLDEKLRSAFDNVRAGDSVKARIKKGITGDDMDNRNITAADNITKSEITATNGKAAVKRSGRITAAAVAAVVAVGGGAYLLKGGFDRVDDKPQSKTESKPESADSYVGSVPADFDGFFDPQGYTLYDKFGKNSDIWRLNSGNFLVRQVNGEGAEYYQFDGQEFCYFLYDGSENAVTKEVKTDGSRVYVYDDCFVTWKTNYGEQDEYGVTVNTTMTCTIYDTDLEVIKDNIELKLDHEDPIGAPIVGADNKLFYAGMSYDGEKNTINVYMENGKKLEEAECSSSGNISFPAVAGNGEHFCYTCDEDDGLHMQVQYLNGFYREEIYSDSGEGFSTSTDHLIFSTDDKCCIAYPDENGKLTVYANPVNGGKSTTTSYEAVYPSNVRNSDDIYVTKGGKFMFVAAPMTDNAGVDIYVYDLEDTSAEAKVFSFEGLSADTFADGRNVLFDEASGDVCIGGFTAAETLPSARQDTVLTFNLYNDEYTNFGIKSGSIKMQTVPDVTGLESEKAQDTLLKANFNAVLRAAWDENVPENCIISTDPRAGTEFPEGGNVTLYISKGSMGEGVKVPNVVGLTQEKAETILKENKLTVSVKEMPHDGDKGMVIDQSTGPDQRVDEGTEVTIFVSTGEAAEVPLTIKLPLPEGLHGAYTVDVYKDGNVAYTQSIANGEAVADSGISLDIIGKKSETLTVSIKNEESGKSVDYAVFNVDYDKKTADLNGRLNKDGLLAITPAK